MNNLYTSPAKAFQLKSYLSIFRIKFINGLQYRAAAYAGVSTQFAWGFMSILMFGAFYKSDPTNFPMTFPQLISYIWLQQAMLSLFAAWAFENDIFSSIASGDVAYELCRPIGIYAMWFTRSTASRVSRAVLRCMPILVVAAILPQPYGISLPPSVGGFVLFLFSSILGLLITVSINMLIYISTFYTLSPMGIKILATSLIELFSGAIIPLPFLPDAVQKFFNLLPFASTQNTPYLIYNGFLAGNDANYAVLLQLFWITALTIAGRLLIKNALKNVVVQGG